MKVNKTTATIHPEGWFLFCLGAPEQVDAEWEGKTKIRLKWACESTERDEDGNRLVVNLFTGVNVSDHKMDVHRQLVEDGFGIKAKDYEDTDEIAGQLFAGKVEKKATTGKASIVQFDTKDRIKPAAKSKAKVERDPFENE